jgi:hypothetical protein
MALATIYFGCLKIVNKKKRKERKRRKKKKKPRSIIIMFDARLLKRKKCQFYLV